MRLLHTSDWHLGHTLRDFDRTREHEAFLAWLLDVVIDREIDALLIAGDVFEAASPPVEAQRVWFRFLADARRRAPALDLVVIGGNHDSAARLDAPDPILRALDVRIVGGLPRTREGAVDVARAVVPITGRDGSRAWVAAIPFLRPQDLASEGALVDGIRAVYRETIDSVRARRGGQEAIVAMGHVLMVDGRVSEQSERRIFGGNQHALPLDVFPNDVAYAALGHLHLAQHVGDAEHVRYSGSPIPLSITEADYRHQVNVIELVDGALTKLESLRIPRSVDMLRLAAGPIDEVVTRLRALPSAGAAPKHLWPFVEIVVELPRPDPTVQQRIDDALADRGARQVRLTRAYPTHVDEEPLEGAQTLGILRPDEVFARRHERVLGGPPSQALLAAFHELVDMVGQAGQAGSTS